VGGRRDDEDRRLAQRDLARAMDDRQPRDPKTGLDLVGDLAQDPQRQRLERLVLQLLDGSAGMARRLRLLARRRRAGGDPRPALEHDDAAVLVGHEPVRQLGGEIVRERVGTELEDPPRTGGAGAAAHGRDAGELVAVRERVPGIRVLAVDGEADRGAARREGRDRGDRRRPRVLHDGAVRELDLQLAPPGCLALHREQPHPDPHQRAIKRGAPPRSRGQRRGSCPRRWTRR
jgi:hypothetical protein